MPAWEDTITVLAVTAAPDEAAFLDTLAGRTRWKVERVCSVSEAASFMAQNDVAVVLSSATLPDGNWKDVLASVSSHGRRARVIVLASRSDDHIWSEVLDSGGYDVLAKPLDATEAVRVISLAWRQWRDSAARAGGAGTDAGVRTTK